MSLLTPPILTPTKVRAYSSVEVYKLRALVACYPALKPSLEPIIKFCEKVQRKFNMDKEYAECKKPGTVSYSVCQHGAELHKKAVLKEAIDLLAGLGEELPEGFFDRFSPPVDHTQALRELDDKIAVLNQELREARALRTKLLEEAGLAHIPQSSLYMREYARRRRQQEKECK